MKTLIIISLIIAFLGWRDYYINGIWFDREVSPKLMVYAVSTAWSIAFLIYLIARYLP
jgi:hypothetical protein